MKKYGFAFIVLLLITILPVSAQGGPGTKDFYIRDFGACVNLPDFTVVTDPDDFNTVYEVPGLFSINFAEYLIPLDTLPATGDDIYNAMIGLLNTVGARDYVRVDFTHSEYTSAAVEFTLDGANEAGSRQFGMIYRNQDDRLFFLFADKVEGFDMLAIGRAIFAADRQCEPLYLAPPVILYEENFEDGVADGWAWRNWVVITDADGNLVWKGQYGQAEYFPADWTDYAVQLRFKYIDTDDFVIGMRGDTQAGYALSLFDQPSVANLARSYPEDWQVLAYGRHAISSYEWNTLIFEARGNVIRVTINGRLFAEVADDAFSSGGVELWAGNSTGVLVDDIRVWSLTDQRSIGQ